MTPTWESEAAIVSGLLPPEQPVRTVALTERQLGRVLLREYDAAGPFQDHSFEVVEQEEVLTQEMAVRVYEEVVVRHVRADREAMTADTLRREEAEITIAGEVVSRAAQDLDRT